MSPKIARGKLRRLGMKPEGGRWPTYQPGSKEHAQSHRGPARGQRRMRKVTSLAEFEQLAPADERYERPDMVAAENLGCDAPTLRAAIAWPHQRAGRPTSAAWSRK